MQSFRRSHPLLFWFLASVVVSVPIGLWVDRPIERAFHDAFGAGALAALNTLTDAGLAGWWFAVAILGWLFCRGMVALALDGGAAPRWRTYARSFLYMLTALLVGGALVQILKFVFGRYRPKLWFTDGLYGLAIFHNQYIPFSHTDSFPSGHSQAIFTAMTAMAVIYPAGRRFFFGLAVSVAISRVLLGLHFPSDILAGSVLGVVSALWVKGWFEGVGKPPLQLPIRRSPVEYGTAMIKRLAAWIEAGLALLQGKPVPVVATPLVPVFGGESATPPG